MFKNKNKNKGFTLIELLLVVLLISILSGIILSVINVAGLRARARDGQRSGDLKRIQTALELYFADNRGYPVSSGSWMVVHSSVNNTLTNALRGTYVQVIPQDPRRGESLSPSVCSRTTYDYWYRTSAGSGTPSLAARYVLITAMESRGGADASICNTLSSCSSLGCGSCGSPCYGVESPL